MERNVFSRAYGRLCPDDGVAGAVHEATALNASEGEREGTHALVYSCVSKGKLFFTLSIHARPFERAGVR